jgi:redox-sensitive bicupin YhaK (pirin superfamily)
MTTLRPILARTRGYRHGPITRLISPDDLGEQLKPFILLDLFDDEVEPGFGFGMHPHSGIATLTWQPGSDVRYSDTTGQNGILKAGGLEWMNAGGGAWHQGSLMGSGRVTGFQLWVALPPGIEDGPSFGQYVAPDAVAVTPVPGGTLRVLLGEIGAGEHKVASPIHAHHDMSYLVLALEPGQSWTYSPPAGHSAAFAFVFSGAAAVQGEASDAALVVLGQEGDIRIDTADQPAKVLIGTAVPHAYPLVMGPSSVHTNEASLAAAMARIREIGAQLRAR